VLKSINYSSGKYSLGKCNTVNQNQPSGEAEKLQVLSTIGEEDDPLVPRIFDMETGF